MHITSPVDSSISEGHKSLDAADISASAVADGPKEDLNAAPVGDATSAVPHSLMKTAASQPDATLFDAAPQSQQNI